MPVNAVVRCKSCETLIPIDVPDIADESANVRRGVTRAMCNVCNGVNDYTDEDILND